MTAFDQIHAAWLQGWTPFAFLASSGKIPPSTSYCFQTEIGYMGGTPTPSPKEESDSIFDPAPSQPTQASSPLLSLSSLTSLLSAPPPSSLFPGEQKNVPHYTPTDPCKQKLPEPLEMFEDGPNQGQNPELERVMIEICRQVPVIACSEDWKARTSAVDLVKWCIVLSDNLTEDTPITGITLEALLGCFENSSRKIGEEGGDTSMQDCFVLAQLFKSVGLNVSNSIHLVTLGAYTAIANHFRRVANLDKIDVKSFLYFLDFLIHSSTIWVKMGKQYDAKKYSVQSYQALAVVIDPDCSALNAAVRCKAMLAILCRVSPKGCPLFYRLNTASLFQIGNGTMMMANLFYWEGWNAVNASTANANPQFSDVITEIVANVTATVGAFEGKLGEQCSSRFNASMDIARERVEYELEEQGEESTESTDSIF